MSREEVNEVKPNLQAVDPYSKDKLDYFKVPFEEALSLVKGRRVYLQKGYAYVSAEQFSSIIAARFRYFKFVFMLTFQQATPLGGTGHCLQDARTAYGQIRLYCSHCKPPLHSLLHL